MSEVKIVRLTSGEELICKVTETESDITIKNPAILIPTGEGQLAFGQWLPYADITKGLTVDKKYIIFMVAPATELSNQYSASFGSGLVVPKKEPVAGAGLSLTK